MRESTEQLWFTEQLSKLSSSPQPLAAGVTAQLRSAAPCMQQGCGSPQCQTYSCMELCRAAAFARGARTADAAHSRTCCPRLADQTNVYCREEEATNCPSTCLTCLARGGVCEIGFKIQYFSLPTLATAYYLSFFLFTENT